MCSIVWGLVVFNRTNGEEAIYGVFQYIMKFIDVICLLILISLLFRTVHRTENRPRQGIQMGLNGKLIESVDVAD